MNLTGLATPDPSVSTLAAKVLPKVGEVMTGASGATARVLDVTQTSGVACRVRLEAINGTFVAGESVSGPASAGGVLDIPDQAYGTVNGTPVYELPTIQEFTSGMFGKAAPNVASTVTCGGTLDINVSGMADDAYDLIVADTVTGTFTLGTVTGGSGTLSYPSGKVVFTKTA